MSRAWVAILVVLALAAGMAPALAHDAGLSARDKELYRAAFAAIAKDHWNEATRLAAKAKDSLPAKVIHWLDLTRPGPGRGFAEYTRFIADNPDWPLGGTLIAQAERAMPEYLPAGQVLAWFGERAPTTLEGAMRLGAALLGQAKTARGEEVLRRGWIEQNGDDAAERAYLGRFKSRLKPADHLARLDRLLWEERQEAAKRMLPMADSGHRALAIARLRLMARGAGVDALLAKVPRELLQDPGLVYDRARWHRRKQNDEQATSLLDPPPVGVASPDLLWPELDSAARYALARGNVQRAYRLAKGHGALSGTAFAEGEWLAGWIALRFLDDGKTALAHFQRLYDIAESGLRKSRGAYWAGRAAERLADPALADKWYRAAAEHLTAYYGQLAAHRLGHAEEARFGGLPKAEKADKAAFDKLEMVRVVRLLAGLGRSEHARAFLLRLEELAERPAESRLVADLALEIGREDFAVAVSKQARQKGVVLLDHLFPVVGLPKGGRLEDPLILAVLRQESGFAVDAVSSVGALGLMQLMPATAKTVAKKLKLKYKKSLLTKDRNYNITLGRAYLDMLVSEYGGSYLLAIAAYNAGPHRVAEWMARNGDPRHRDVDTIDWVEGIPFEETRNFVQRVMENLQVYRHRLGKTQVALRLEQDLNRRTQP